MVLWKHQIWNILVQIANFRRHVQDVNKGKHIFMDSDIEAQNQAVQFYDLLRNTFLQWAKQLGKIQTASENQFLSAFYQIFGGVPDVQLGMTFLRSERSKFSASYQR